MSDVPAPRREPKLVTRLKERKESHRQRHPLYRAAFVAAGLACLLAGIAMLLLPGPAFVVIPIGLALLALEFTWAEKLLDRALREAANAQDKAERTTPRQRAARALAAGIALAAFVVAALRWDIPLLPV